MSKPLLAFKEPVYELVGPQPHGLERWSWSRCEYPSTHSVSLWYLRNIQFESGAAPSFGWLTQGGGHEAVESGAAKPVAQSRRIQRRFPIRSVRAASRPPIIIRVEWLGKIRSSFYVSKGQFPCRAVCPSDSSGNVDSFTNVDFKYTYVFFTHDFS